MPSQLPWVSSEVLLREYVPAPTMGWIRSLQDSLFRQMKVYTGRRVCAQVMTSIVVLPAESFEWTYLLPFPVTRDTLTLGKHAVVSEVIGCGLSAIWVTVTTVNAVNEEPAAARGYTLENYYPHPFQPFHNYQSSIIDEQYCEFEDRRIGKGSEDPGQRTAERRDLFGRLQCSRAGRCESPEFIFPGRGL